MSGHIRAEIVEEIESKYERKYYESSLVLIFRSESVQDTNIL